MFSGFELKTYKANPQKLSILHHFQTTEIAHLVICLTTSPEVMCFYPWLLWLYHLWKEMPSTSVSNREVGTSLQRMCQYWLGYPGNWSLAKTPTPSAPSSWQKPKKKLAVFQIHKLCDTDQPTNHHTVNPYVLFPLPSRSHCGGYNEHWCWIQAFPCLFTTDYLKTQKTSTLTSVRDKINATQTMQANATVHLKRKGNKQYCTC